MEGKAIGWKIRGQALKTWREVNNVTRGEGGVFRNTHRVFFPPGFADAMETSKKSENKEREKGSVLFSFCLLLGDLADGQGKETRSLQWKRQHLINND